MEERINPRQIKEIDVKGVKYRTYKGRFLPPEKMSDPKVRGGRIKEILRVSGPRMLNPGDFYFAWKWGLLNDNNRYSFSQESEDVEHFRALPSAEKRRLIKEDTESPIAYLARKFGLSGVYVQRIRKGDFD